MKAEREKRAKLPDIAMVKLGYIPAFQIK